MQPQRDGAAQRSEDSPSGQGAAAAAAPGPLPLPALRHRLDWLQWLLPAGMLLAVAVFELLVAPWVTARWGLPTARLAHVALYGLLGPVLLFGLLRLARHWLEERETAELQARVLAQARAHARQTHDLTDDLLQSVFGLSILLGSLRAQLSSLPPDSTPGLAALLARLAEAEAAVQASLQQLYAGTAHLRSGSTPHSEEILRK